MTPQPPTPQPEVEDRAEKVEEHVQALARKPARTLRELLQGDDFLKAVAEVSPRVMRPSRFIRAALTAMMRVPLLAECTRESFFKAMLDCAFYGLEPDGRRAHLIPFKNRKAGTVECQLIVDYKGLAELVRRSGDVSDIHADVVYPDDEFDLVYGTGGHLTHKPGETRTGKPKKFYSYVKLKDGSESYEMMTLAEVEKIRKRSKSPDEGPWVTDFNEMGKKTVFRRHSKWLPLSPESRFNLDRSEPDDIQASNTWNDMMAEGAEAAQPLRLKASEKILGQPSYAHDASAEPEPAEPPK
jgi:recombination protein RecT